MKKRKYEQRIREVEHGCFSPLIFSTSGGCGPVSTLLIKRLAILHSEKFHSATINFIQCRYSFAILKSAIRCLRGSRSKMRLFDSNDFSRAISNAHLSLSELIQSILTIFLSFIPHINSLTLSLYPCPIFIILKKSFFKGSVPSYTVL